MRILHTSDWHLGRRFHGVDLHPTMTKLLDEMIQLIEEEKIDVLLISGDIYDQAQPKPESVQLLNQTLTRLIQQKVQVVAISGNHDSAVRLGFGSQIMKEAGLHLITSSEQVGQPVLIQKEGVSVAFYGIPYLEPRALAHRWQVEPSHRGVLTEAMRRIQADYDQTPADARIVLAHCFTQGGEPSESERNIQVGGIFDVPVSIFQAADYLALGHLHGQQTISDKARYSGSLLAYSFSERKHRKGAWILDIDQDGKIQVSDYRWKTKLELKDLQGTLTELLAEEKQATYREAYLRLTVTDDQRPAGAYDLLKAAYPHLMELNFAPASPQPEKGKSIYRQLGPGADRMDIISDFYRNIRQRELNQAEKEHLEGVLETIRQERADA